MNTMNRRTFKRLVASVVILSASVMHSPAFAAAAASVNRSQVAMDESLVLSLETDQGQGQAAPDLTPLANEFDILGTGQQSRTSIINGVVTATNGWTITLMPKRLGQATIPAIQIGTESTQPIEIQVVDSGSVANSAAGPATPTAGKTPNIELSVPDGPFYAQQEIPLTVRIFGAEALRRAELSLIDIANAVVTPVDGETVNEVMKDGQPTTVVEKTYRIKPQDSGSLTIPPVVLQGIQSAPRGSRGRSRDPFDVFGSLDPSSRGFGRGLLSEFFDRGQRVSFRSQSLTLEIEQRPAEITGWFLPAKRVELSASWAPESPTFRVGEAVSRVVQLTALGASKEQLPDLSINDGEGFDLYTDRTVERTSDTRDGVAAIKQVSLSVIPTRDGEVVLPAIKVSWWDTEANAERVAVLPSETIKVLPGAAGTTSREPSTLTSSQETAASPSPDSQITDADNIKALVTFALLGLGLFAAFAVRRRKGSLAQADDLDSATRGQSRALESQLRQACANNNAEIAFDRLQRLLGTEVDKTVLAQDLRDAMRALEVRLFSGRSDADDWNGKALLAAYDAFSRHKGHRVVGNTGKPKLPALYPNTTTLQHQ